MPLADVRAFLRAALQVPVFDARVRRAVARRLHVSGVAVWSLALSDTITR